jgi:Xaa-Pro aminopeptidase
MRHDPIDSSLFLQNRRHLQELLAPGALAVLNANDVPPTNADGSLPLVPNTNLFYLSGIEQEESLLVLFPDAVDPAQREILFIRETNEQLKIWEGQKLTRDEASQISGIKNVKWLDEFPHIFRGLMAEAELVYLDSNEHPRATVEVETRNARFVAECRKQYPLHTYRRLAPLMHRLRAVKSPAEISLLREAIRVTELGFRRLLTFVRPDVSEFAVEAELAHEFVRNRCTFAYTPIVASGANSCVLHYIENNQTCRDGDLLLLDIGARYANYNADLTRTIPVNGRFTPRQRAVYDAVLRVHRAAVQNSTVGKSHQEWTRDAQLMMNEELLRLGLLTKEDIAGQSPESPACRRYFMHGLGHSLGLDVHDISPLHARFEAGWVVTVEPGIYIPEEGFGIRIENDVLITQDGPVDLMKDIPIEAEEIEDLMAMARKPGMVVT